MLSTLNWRRDPDYEQRMNDKLIEIERIKIDRLRIENEILQIENETEQLRRENARLKALNASVRRLCFPPASSSTPQPATAPDCGPSSP